MSTDRAKAYTEAGVDIQATYNILKWVFGIQIFKFCRTA